MMVDKNHTNPIAFVTGGTGFIGSHLVEELHRRGYREIRCLVRTNLRWLEGMDITPVRGEIQDTAVLRDALRDVDHVFHVGGVTRAEDWATFEAANVRAPITLLEILSDVNPHASRMVITSSLAAVGACDAAVATETAPLRPVSDYGRSKAQMEREVKRWTERHGSPPVIIIRPPAVYGPREADIYTFFRTVSRGIVPIVGRGAEPAVSLVHVADLVRGIVDAAFSDTTPGRTYFVGSERPVSWAEVKDATTEALGKRALTVPVPEMLIEPVGAVVEGVARLFGSYPPLNREKAREIRYACKMCSSERARRDFGYQPHVGLREGIAGTIDWYRRNGWL